MGLLYEAAADRLHHRRGAIALRRWDRLYPRALALAACGNSARHLRHCRDPDREQESRVLVRAEFCDASGCLSLQPADLDRRAASVPLGRGHAGLRPQPEKRCSRMAAATWPRSRRRVPREIRHGLFHSRPAAVHADHARTPVLANKPEAADRARHYAGCVRTEPDLMFSGQNDNS